VAEEKHHFIMNEYFISPIKQRFLALWVTTPQFEEWKKQWKFFFILGVGRSGTTFLTNLLNQAPGAYVFHEPTFEDFNASIQAFYSSHIAERYIQGFRKKEIYLRMRHTTPGVYGEVNGALRRHAEALKKAFAGATIVHLIRDGRDVVRSLMSRRTMTLKDPFNIRLHPVGRDPWRARWNSLDRFSRLCWLWQVENAYLRTTLGKPVQFEKILSSYEYFQNEILQPCHLSIEKKDWQAAVVSPRNITSSFRMPKWSDWSLDQQKTFREICGDEMAKSGYAF
jgi:hypothetical protein